MEVVCHTDVETQALIAMMFTSINGTRLSVQMGALF